MRPHEEEAALPREDQRTTDDGEAEHEWQKKIGGWSAVERRGERKKILNLKTGFEYHVMDSTCIHMGIECSNIYMYMKRKIYKEHSKGIQ
jgi:hypothetical protein